MRLRRLLSDFTLEPVILLTETNVPSAENLAYFGNFFKNPTPHLAIWPNRNRVKWPITSHHSTGFRQLRSATRAAKAKHRQMPVQDYSI